VTYTVKDGDTLTSIAARELGDVTKWVKIAALNGIRDPRALTVGQVIQLRG
jgi:nucleoid-associated protein YgaU